MRYRLRFHPAVDDDIKAIELWLLRYSDTPFERMSEIGETLQLLEEFPNLGSPRPDVAPGLRAFPTSDQGVVAFVVNGDNVEVLIVAITYAGADWMSRSRARLTDLRD